MPDHCKCGAEINDTTEFCPACGRNIRAERAEAALKIADGAIDGWRAEVKRLKARNERLEASLKALGVIQCQEDTNGEWVPNPEKK